MEHEYKTPLGNDGMYVLDTASWRVLKPVMDKNECVNCGMCLAVCPVGSVYAQGKEFLISYDYCKGCGLCAAECPKKAIDMVPEVK
jgi:pyruvate ferredoxin oxidoreductase delta subunit